MDYETRMEYLEETSSKIWDNNLGLSENLDRLIKYIKVNKPEIRDDVKRDLQKENIEFELMIKEQYICQ